MITTHFNGLLRITEDYYRFLSVSKDRNNLIWITIAYVALLLISIEVLLIINNHNQLTLSVVDYKEFLSCYGF